MTKTINFISLIFLCWANLTFGQTSKQFKGDFANGASIPGQAVFDYYEKDGKMIKHGTFSYYQKLSSSYGFYECKITGNYINGQKNGIWSYDISFSDYDSGNGIICATGYKKLTSSYDNGLPIGNWKYSASNKVREKIITGWSNFDLPEETTVEANFNKGILVGDLILKNVADNTFENINGRFDGNGFAVGKWELIRGKANRQIFTINFYKNVQLNHITTESNSGKTLDKSNLSIEEMEIIKSYADNKITYDRVRDNQIKIDTITCVTNGFLNLNSTLYNPQFLPRYIKGDYCFDESSGKFTNLGSKMILSEKTKYYDLSGFDNYVEAIWIIEDEKSTPYQLNNAKGKLNLLLETNGKLFNEEQISLIKSKIDLCDSLKNSKESVEQSKQLEYDAIMSFNPNEHEISKIEEFILKAKSYNVKYSSKSSVSNSIENQIDKMERVKQMKLEKYRKEELNYISLIDTKKQTKEQLIENLNRVKKFEEQFQTLRDNETMIINEKKSAMQKALDKLEK